MRPLAVVSGATGGIGRAVVEALWSAGYAIIALGRAPEKIEQLRQWFWTHHREGQWASVFSYNCAERSQDDILDGALYNKEPTLLVIGHGASPHPCRADEAEHALRVVFETDVMGTLNLCNAVGKRMLDTHTKGSMVIVSSLHAKTTYPFRLPYATCKAAIGGLVRSLALEYGAYGITVNAILPWQCTGSRTAQVASKEGDDTWERWRQKSPLRRFVEPQDVASTVLWLAGCPSVTGTEIILDCGVSASMWHRPFEES